MKQKAVIMATAFSMLLSVGVTGIGSETLHRHPAYANQTVEREAQKILSLSAPGNEILLLTGPADQENK